VKTIENFSHPNQAHLTSHTGPTRHVFLEVDRVEGLWRTKKSQFGERFCEKRIFFLTRVPYTRPCTHRAHPIYASPVSHRIEKRGFYGIDMWTTIVTALVPSGRATGWARGGGSLCRAHPHAHPWRLVLSLPARASEVVGAELTSNHPGLVSVDVSARAPCRLLPRLTLLCRQMTASPRDPYAVAPHRHLVPTLAPRRWPPHHAGA
jgi:hypothetical protein